MVALKTDNCDPADIQDQELSVYQSVTLVGFQKNNWGRHSGANGIMNVVPARRILLEKSVSGIVYRPWKLFRSYFQKYNTWYDANPAYLELRVAVDWMRQKNRIFHFLSGDNEYLFSGGLKRLKRGHRIVCTFHSPAEEFTRIVSNHPNLRHVDAAIVVSSSQLPFFQSLIGANRVWQIPHGIDTSYWRPQEEARDPDSELCHVVFVGSHLRDIDTLRRVIQNVSAAQKKIQFHAVVSKEDALALTGVSGLRIHRNLGDDQLRALYQSANIFLCPLLQCTASNSLLESMSCGVPIISTDIGGVRDYVTDDCASLIAPGKAEEMTDALLALAADSRKQKQMGLSARQRALELDWKVVARSLAKLYSHLLELPLE